MVIFKEILPLQKYINRSKTTNSVKVGFVPTMGALHQGHLSLVAQAKRDGNLAICSIFLNPTQFNNKDDFDKYPVSIDNDVHLLLQSGCDVLFVPDIQQIYPSGTQQHDVFGFGTLEQLLEGAQRPGHFQGVGQVVARLFDIVHPDTLYLGQKDYQQCLIIQKLVELLKLQIAVKICPTVREEDGLAMSSRNQRMTVPQRIIAASIYQCLVSIRHKIDATPFAVLQRECVDLLTAKGFEPEYVALGEANTLQPLEVYQPELPAVVLIAAKIGGIRLIDNILLGNSSI
jgi:pantoate--beta-alanine ligase